MSLRQAVRNFLLPMTRAEMTRELELSVERGDTARADCIKDYIKECDADGE